MDYELAKELKDADFSQYASEGTIVLTPRDIGYVCHQGDYCNALSCTNCPMHNKGILQEWAVVPTLSALIEACDPYGKNFELGHHRDHWYANIFATDDSIIERQGHNPGQAVARLWLALRPAPNRLSRPSS